MTLLINKALLSQPSTFHTMKASTGFSMPLGSASKSKSKPAAAPGSTKLGGKSRLAHDESDDEACDDGRVELVQAFDQRNGAIGASDGERGGGGGPLIIPVLKNRDWREESLKRKRVVWMPPEVRMVGGDAGDSSETVGGNTGQAGQAGYGLQVMIREEKMGGEDEEGVMVKDGEGGDVTIAGGDDNGEPKTEDQLALEALVSGDSKKTSTLVLAPQNNSLDWREARAKSMMQSETDAYRADLARRPDVPDLAAYEAVPVEEFGAALLRGMGWKEGMELGARGKKAGEKGAKPKAVERRPALLGLGAKTQAEAMGMELGGWGKGDKATLGAKGGKGWVDKTYVPVVLRNKVTGQIMDSLPPRAKGGTNREERARGREIEIRGEIRKERGDGEDTDGSEKRRRRKDYDDREGGRDRREYDISNGTQTDRKLSRREKDREYDQVRRDRCREKERDRDRRDRDRDKERDRDRESRKDEDRDKDRVPDHNKERVRDRRRGRVDDYDRRRRSSRSRERW